MAGVGKSTIGRLLARTLQWAHLDTDQLIEAFYGLSLQQVMDQLALNNFLYAEELVVGSLGTRRCVVSTGGSVVYGARAIQRLQQLGPIIFLQASLETIQKRIGNVRQRGLAIAPGQSLASLYADRQPLYTDVASFIVHTDAQNPEKCVDLIMNWLEEEP